MQTIPGRTKELLTMLTCGVRIVGRETGEGGSLFSISSLCLLSIHMFYLKKWIKGKSECLGQEQEEGWCFDPQSRKGPFWTEDRGETGDGGCGPCVSEPRPPPGAE